MYFAESSKVLRK